MDNTEIVYVRVDNAGRVTGIGSRSYITDLDGWIRIDEGRGDRYRHAQAQYFSNPLMDERGVWRYRLDGITPVERTQEEMDADAVSGAETPTQEERIAALEAGSEMLTACVLEMSELVYA